MNINMNGFRPLLIEIGVARKEWKGLVADLKAAEDDGLPLDEDLLNACMLAGHNFRQLSSELASQLYGYCPELFESEEGTGE